MTWHNGKRREHTRDGKEIKGPMFPTFSLDAGQIRDKLHEQKQEINNPMTPSMARDWMTPATIYDREVDLQMWADEETTRLAGIMASSVNTVAEQLKKLVENPSKVNDYTLKDAVGKLSSSATDLCNKLRKAHEMVDPKWCVDTSLDRINNKVRDLELAIQRVDPEHQEEMKKRGAHLSELLEGVKQEAIQAHKANNEKKE